MDGLDSFEKVVHDKHLHSSLDNEIEESKRPVGWIPWMRPNLTAEAKKVSAKVDLEQLNLETQKSEDSQQDGSPPEGTSHMRTS